MGNNDLDNLLGGMDGEMSEEDLGAMLRSLMEDDGDGGWNPGDNIVEIEEEPEPEPEPDFEDLAQEDELVAASAADEPDLGMSDDELAMLEEVEMNPDEVHIAFGEMTDAEQEDFIAQAQKMARELGQPALVSEEPEEPKKEKAEKEPSEKFSVKGLKSFIFGFRNGLIESDGKERVMRLGILGLGGLAALAIIFVVTLTVINIFTNDDTSRPVHIAAPGHPFNNASHSFVNLSAYVADGDRITVNRVLLDATATVFYFDGVLDLERYNFVLTDLNGRSYRQDITFAQNHERQYLLDRTVLRFEPLDAYAEGLSLEITDLTNGETITLVLMYESDTIMPARYVNNPSRFEDVPVHGLVVQIESGTFSAAGSTLDISIAHNFRDGDIVFSPTSSLPPMSLGHRGFFTPTINGVMQTASFGGGLVLGRMDFSPLRTLYGEIEIILDGMYRRYDIGESLPISPMMMIGADRAVRMDLSANHRVSLEGMLRQSYFFVMPMHGLRLGQIGTDGIRADDERVAITINASLVGTNAAGQQVRLAGRVTSGTQGADVLFDTRDDERILEIPSSQIRLEVESIYIRLPQMTHHIDLNELANWDISEERQNITAQLERHFGGAQVSTLRISGDNIHAVLMDRQGSLNITHRVVATMNNGELIITE
ncbi:MAG: hypothetical protein FWC67_01810 [Defluviitaleaceae bacterium]|nr:hypothetical protein [Defluviitaleaceae bacterium]